MLRRRLISAGLLVPIVVAFFAAGQPWLTLGMAAVALLGGREAARLLAGGGLPVGSAIVWLAPPLAVLGLGLFPERAVLGTGFVAAVMVLAALVAFRRPVARDGFLAWIGTSFGALYVSLIAFMPGILAVAPPVGGSAPLAGLLDAGRIWLLVVVVTVWSYDSAAFLIGRAFGKRSFLSHISPHKTWAGVIGGTIAACTVAGALVWAAGQDLIGGILLGLILAVTAQAGDLAESLLKRAADMKDSGALIPGHGGVLDRIDSFLFAAPAAYVALTWSGALWAGAPR